MRHLPLFFALALVGCPASDPAPAPDSDAVTFSDAQKGKPAFPSRGSETDDAEAPASVTVETVVVGRTATVRDPEDGFLFLRNGPGTEAEALDRMPNGSRIQVNACQPGTEGRRWCRVTYEQRDGWAHESRLDYTGAAESGASETTSRRAVVSDPDGWTNLRERPSTEAAIVSRLDNGTALTVGACQAPGAGSRSRWCPVTVAEGTLSGWIAESRLRYP
ncbi:MAG: SH3 domain-containing protein [Bacteroidota bacterium]